MQVKIFQPMKSAMQSAPQNRQQWFLEFESYKGSRFIEDSMGWTASKDMNGEIIIKFNTKEAAIKFAKTHNLEYEVIELQVRKIVKKAYADNFK